jgi:hypothetical protein
MARNVSSTPGVGSTVGDGRPATSTGVTRGTGAIDGRIANRGCAACCCRTDCAKLGEASASGAAWATVCALTGDAGTARDVA